MTLQSVRLKFLGFSIAALFASGAHAIVGGKQIKADDPFARQVARLVIERPAPTPSGRERIRCSATFIDRHLVLTAAHCLVPHQVLSLSVSFGIDDTDRGFETTAVVTASNENYDPVTRLATNDVALIYTTDPLPDDYIITSLAKKPRGNQSSATAIGHGIDFYLKQKTPHGPIAFRLKSLPLSSFRPSSFGLWYSAPINAKKGASGGDSGGPAFAMEDGVLKQVGVASSIANDVNGDHVDYAAVILNAEWIRTTGELLATAAANRPPAR